MRTSAHVIECLLMWVRHPSHPHPGRVTERWYAGGSWHLRAVTNAGHTLSAPQAEFQTATPEEVSNAGA